MGELSVCLYTILGVFLTPMALAVGERAKDKIFNWSHRNYKETINKAVEKLEARGYTKKEEIKYPSDKFIHDFAEGASSEDDPDLQDLWATLLANAADPNFKEEIRRSYFSIIKDLSPLDVKFINLLITKTEKYPKYAFGDGWPKIDYIADFASELNETKDDINVSYENLSRLNIVDNKKNVNVVSSDHPITYSEKQQSETVISNRYPYFTSLGLAFIKACVDDAGNNKAGNI